MPAILDFDFARPASYDPTDMVGVACVRSLASSAHPGTYVGQDGLIKLAPHNLVLWSEDWTNAAWTKTDCTITANSATSPDGTANADTLNSTVAGGRAIGFAVATATSSHAISVFVKAGTASSVTILLRNNTTATNLAEANFSLTSGASSALTGAGAVAFEGENVGNGWWRIAVASSGGVTAGNSLALYVYPATSSGTGTSYAWGAQINLGPIPLDYVKTTSAANGGTRIGWGPREPYQNLLLQTTWPDAGANPTGWTVGSGSNGNTNSKWGSAAQARTFTTSTSRSYITQAVTLVSNTTYSIGIRVEEISGTLTLANVLDATSLPGGCTITGYAVDGVTFASSTQALAGTTVSITLGGTYTGASITVRVGNGVASNATGTVKLSRPNLNEGTQAYNWYPTTSTAVYVTPFDLVGNWECHGAMSEGLRTNLCTYSEQFDNAVGAHPQANMTVAANDTTAPDGGMTADRLTATATAATTMREEAVITGTAAAYSVFVKKGSSATAGNEFTLRNFTTSTDLVRFTLNYDTGAITYTTGSSGAAARDYGSGWWRVEIVATSGITSGDIISGYAGARATPMTAGDFWYAWGVQLESAAVVGSYVPTGASAVTRNADAISYTLSGPHATALSSQGTVVVEYRLQGGVPNSGSFQRRAVSIDDGTASNRIWVGTGNTTNAIRAIVETGAVGQTANIVSAGIAVGSRVVAAFSYATNNANLAANGTPVNNDASCIVPTVARIGFGANSFGGSELFGTIKRVTIFSTALTDAQVVSASKPVEPTAHWRTYDGTHRTASDTDKTVSCDIEADVDLDTAGEDGVQRVEFYVSVNGVLSSIATQTSRSQRTHNSTPASANGFLTTWGYGITVDCSALTGGTITVDATVFSKLGAISYLPTLTIYNDTDGTDRRPSSAIVYYDYDLGDDTTGTGTFANPFKNPRAAMNSLSGDIGGATIRAKGRTVGMTPSSSYSASGWSTSGKWALTFEAVGTDKTWQRITPGTFSDPQDYILGTSGAARVRMRFKDFEFKGPGPTLYVNGPNAQIDEVNCLVRSHKWTPADTNAHVDYEQYGSGGVDLALNGTSRGVRNSWGGQWKGVARGPAGYTSLFNFSIDKFLGIALQTSNDLGANPLISNGELHFIRYTAGRLDGLIQTNPNFSQLAGANVTVSVQASGPHTGKMRIEATNSTPNDFGTAAGHLVGSTRWGVTVSSATSGANNGTFAALEGGLNGFGRPYCILDNASAVAEVGSAGFNMDTGTLVGGNRYIDVIHTDGLQMYGPHVGAAFTNVRVYDCENMRSWVGSNLALTRCVLKNLSDGSHSSLRTCAFDFDNGPVILKDCIFSFLSINSNTVNFAGSFAGTNFVDVVFGNGNAVPTVGTFIHSCHFITGASPGTNPSTGAWFNTEPGVTPFDYTPSSGNLGTASGLQDAPPFWRHAGSGAASRGAWSNVATGNWASTLGAGPVSPNNSTRNWSDLNIGCGLVL